jgi:hypothetical protein
VRTTAMVNHYCFYGIDEDFGPFFLKICTYFPYNVKLYINGHEYVKLVSDSSSPVFDVSPFAMDRFSSGGWNFGATSNRFFPLIPELRDLDL